MDMSQGVNSRLAPHTAKLTKAYHRVTLDQTGGKSKRSMFNILCCVITINTYGFILAKPNIKGKATPGACPHWVRAHDRLAACVAFRAENVRTRLTLTAQRYGKPPRCSRLFHLPASGPHRDCRLRCTCLRWAHVHATGASNGNFSTNRQTGTDRRHGAGYRRLRLALRPEIDKHHAGCGPGRGHGSRGVAGRPM